MGAFQLAQARLVEEPPRVVGRHQPLISAQHRGAIISAESHFIAEEISVAGVEHPTFRTAHCHSAMTESVPRERHDQDFRRHADQLAHAGKAEPAFSLGRIALPIDVPIPLHRPIPLAIEPAALRSCGVELGAKDVDRGIREIFDAAGVVKIQVRQYDVAHIGSAEPELFDLPQSGIGLA